MPDLGRGAGASTGRDEGAGLEHGCCRHIRVISGAGRLVGVKVDIPVTRCD